MAIFDDNQRTLEKTCQKLGIQYSVTHHPLDSSEKFYVGYLRVLILMEKENLPAPLRINREVFDFLYELTNQTKNTMITTVEDTFGFRPSGTKEDIFRQALQAIIKNDGLHSEISDEAMVLSDSPTTSQRTSDKQSSAAMPCNGQQQSRPRAGGPVATPSPQIRDSTDKTPSAVPLTGPSGYKPTGEGLMPTPGCYGSTRVGRSSAGRHPAYASALSYSAHPYTSSQEQEPNGASRNAFSVPHGTFQFETQPENLPVKPSFSMMNTHRLGEGSPAMAGLTGSPGIFGKDSHKIPASSTYPIRLHSQLKDTPAADFPNSPTNRGSFPYNPTQPQGYGESSSADSMSFLREAFGLSSPTTSDRVHKQQQDGSSKIQEPRDQPSFRQKILTDEQAADMGRVFVLQLANHPSLFLEIASMSHNWPRLQDTAAKIIQDIQDLTDQQHGIQARIAQKQADLYRICSEAIDYHTDS
ncbi:hypothetical protein DL769_007687 [Monosporascus sp. CRB-8-3]|nr:hypothetical protein DL769_007687 [Monosporascus sp. CRB-8-3]